MSGYTEENFNRLLERLHKRERVIIDLRSLVEEYKAGFIIMEGCRNYWREMYKRVDAEFEQYCKAIRESK